MNITEVGKHVYYLRCIVRKQTAVSVRMNAFPLPLILQIRAKAMHTAVNQADKIEVSPAPFHKPLYS